MKDLSGIVLLDRYQLQAELGRGGMGTVYQAHDTVLKRDVAIKLLSVTGLGTEGKARMLREAQSAAGLNHPNLVAVYDAGEADLGGTRGATPFVVMELVEGHNLHEEPPRDLEHTLAIASQLCAALDHAHSHHIIHRDLKPENVLLTVDGTAKLVDFGLARSVSSRLTTEGTIVGTLDYMAPELALGQAFDGRVDLYSLGVMLYELTTGQLPFEADDPVSVITQHLYAPVVPPRAHNPELAPSLDALIVRLMAKEQQERPASAAEVLEGLKSLDLEEGAIEPVEELSLLDRIVRGRLVGREKELAEARALWSRAASGEGQTLLISGEPGIGKTRLTRELVTQVEVTGGKVIVGECYAGGGAPYAPFAQIVRRSLQNREEALVDLPEYVLADLMKLAPDLQPRYRYVTPNPDLDPEAEQMRLFEHMVAFIHHLSEGRSLLLVFEDTHWADSGSLALLHHLVRRLRKRSVMIVATYREEELDEALPFNQMLLDLNRERLAVRIKLSRFSRREAEAMLAALFAEEITSRFLDGIYRETEGNPFFIEEVCKSLVESGQLYYEESSWHRPQNMADMAIPQSVRVAIQSRVSRFPEEYQETFNLAAILGREFDFDTLVEASDLNEDTLIDALEAAEGAQLIEEVSGKGGTTFSFAHALIPTTLTEGVRSLRRKRLHLRAAQSIEKIRPEAFEELAHHYEEVGDEKQARSYYIKAGERAAAAFANPEAESYFRSALILAENDLDRASLLSNIGVALASQGQFDQAIETWSSASSVFESLNLLDHAAWCYARSARAAWEDGDFQRGLRIGERGVVATGTASETEELADLLHETARAYHFNGIPDKARPLCERSREMAELLGAVQIEAEALSTWAVLDGTSADESISALEQAIDLAKTHNIPDTESRAHNNLAVMLGIYRGELDAAREHLREAARIAHATGLTPIELFYRIGEIGWAAFQGDLAYVDSELLLLQRLQQELGNPGNTEVFLGRMAAHAVHFRGDFQSANKLYQRNIDKSREGGLLQNWYWNGMWFAEMLIDMDEFEEAKDILLDVIGIGEKIGGGARPRFQLAVLEAKLGEIQSAEESLAQAEKQFAENPAALWVPWAEWARALVALGKSQPTEAWGHFSKCVESVKSMRLNGVLGTFLLEWANALIKHGEGEDLKKIEELVREARAVFESLEAPNYIAMTDAALIGLDSSAS